MILLKVQPNVACPLERTTLGAKALRRLQLGLSLPDKTVKRLPFYYGQIADRAVIFCEQGLPPTAYRINHRNWLKVRDDCASLVKFAEEPPKIIGRSREKFLARTGDVRGHVEWVGVQCL